MDDPLFPWWSVLLVGMWAVALTLWLHPAIHREVRLWAGLSSLVYLILIYLALGGNPRPQTAVPSSSTSDRVIDLLLAICVVVSLITSVWLLGRIPLLSRCICYLVLTLANAGVCAVMHQPEVAMGLVIVAALASRPLVREWPRLKSRSRREWFADFTRFTDETIFPDNRGEFYLIGSLAGALALVSLGTISYSFRVEASRTTASPRHTALPSHEQLDRILPIGKGSFRETRLINLVFGARADIVVLMMVVVFLSLAITLNNPPRPKTERLADADDARRMNVPESIHER